MLMQPCRGMASTRAGRISPYAATTMTSQSNDSSWRTASSGFREGSLATEYGPSAAHFATALGVSFSPRPAGRSGWVSTRTMSCPAPWIAARTRAAKEGVPAKTTRKASAVSGGLALAFLELRANAVLFQLGEVVDENLAVQVIHLVLDARGEQSRGIQREAGA